MASKLDLDVSDPVKVISVLFRAAEAYEESAEELNTAWQDRTAGEPWIVCAKALRSAAERIAKQLKL